MEMLWKDLVNTDWHDYRGTGKNEDLLLQPGRAEYLLERWDIQGIEPGTTETIMALRQLRTLLQGIIQAFLEHRQPEEQDIAALNAYFEQAPSRLLLAKGQENFTLEQVPYQRNWSWVFSKIAASFASILVDYEPSRIKQCENPDCRWVYYDESSSKSRRWCEESCGNIMRIRHFRERHRQTNTP